MVFHSCFLEFEMIRKRRYDGENADLFYLVDNFRAILRIDVILGGEIEEGIVMVIQIVDADFKDTLTVVSLVRLDKLHANIKMMEGLHTEVILLPIVLHIAHILGYGIVLWRKIVLKIVVQVLGRIEGGGQRDRVAGGEDPRQGEVHPGRRRVHQHKGHVVATVVAGKERLPEVQFLELLLGPRKRVADPPREFPDLFAYKELYPVRPPPAGGHIVGPATLESPWRLLIQNILNHIGEERGALLVR